MSAHELLSEAFSRGLKKGLERLSGVLLEHEMGGLSGYLYNRVSHRGRIAETAAALKKYRVTAVA